MPAVKPQPSESRNERAARTRTRMLDAAYRLFCERGWSGTTMQLIASEAGVAVQTVYFTFGTKARLLAEVEQRSVLGDSSLRAWFERWDRQAAAETDPRELVRLFVEVDTEIKRRLAPLVAALGTALTSSARAQEERESGRDRFFGSLITRLQLLGALRPGLAASRALDIVRALDDLGTYTDLTLRRHWSEDEWREWMIGLLCEQLLA
jgi:AcrR family transcriptional regulator